YGRSCSSGKRFPIRVPLAAMAAKRAPISLPSLLREASFLQDPTRSFRLMSTLLQANEVAEMMPNGWTCPLPLRQHNCWVHSPPVGRVAVQYSRPGATLFPERVVEGV